MGFLKNFVNAPGNIGGIIGSAIGIGQSMIDRKTQQMNIDKTNQANMRLAEYQYKKDQDMFNLANEYNSPIQQMARFKDAGLNPNLIYGQGNAGNTAVSLPKYQAPHVNYDYKATNLAPIIGQFQDFKLRQAQIDNVNANTNAKIQATITEGINQGLKQFALDKQKGFLPLQRELLEYQTAKGKFSSENEFMRGNILKHQADILQIVKKNKEDLLKGQMNLINKNIQLLNWREKNMIQEELIKKISVKYGDWNNISKLINDGLGSVSKFLSGFRGAGARAGSKVYKPNFGFQK